MALNTNLALQLRRKLNRYVGGFYPALLVMLDVWQGVLKKMFQENAFWS